MSLGTWGVNELNIKFMVGLNLALFTALTTGRTRNHCSLY